MTTYAAPAPVYLGPPAHFTPGSNKPIERIVIHCTVSPCVAGGARDTASYFRNTTAKGSAHYAVDPHEVVQAAYDSVNCWHAPPSGGSLGVELCDPMAGTGARWHDDDHLAMLEHAAELVAGLCLAYDVPVRKLDAGDLKLGKRGICGHDDVSDAFKESTHWDPGPAFPWPYFMQRVRHYVRKLSNEMVQPPAPTPHETTKPSRVLLARRLLRRALNHSDDVHRRQSIAAALRELPRT